LQETAKLAVVTPPSETPMLQLLAPDGTYGVPSEYQRYGDVIAALGEDQLKTFYRDMARIRRFDIEAIALQRQGQLGLWVPAIGQEAAQIGSGYAVGQNDHIFPSYREHGVAITHGVELMSILKMMRGVNHGGWNPEETRFHLYAIVLGTQVLHAVGYAMGVKLDGKMATGDKDSDLAVISYLGDGATAEGDVSESLLFAAVNEAPIVFFVQNNQWAISSNIADHTKVPLYRRGDGFGVPGMRIDGNDVLASYAATKIHMDEAREGGGPFLIEALTYRIGAHTTSDDPTKYRANEEVESWKAKDPIARFEVFLRRQGIADDFFKEVEAAGDELAKDIREQTFALGLPPVDNIFNHVYSEEHPEIDRQRAWLKAYEAQMGGEH
jgi:2-oxoisovalerate dehydrogenase E1 component alpha subunit